MIKFIVLKKIYDVLTNRPGRLLKKDFYSRLKPIVQSALTFRKLPRSERPRLYFDVSILASYDNKTGVQRVIRSVFAEMKPLLADKYDVVPVSCTALTSGFYALEETENNIGEKKFSLTGYKISPERGDVFLSFEQAFVEHLAQEDTFKEMNNKGCRIILTVYDLLQLQLPNCFPVEVNSIFQNWLSVSSKYAEFLCDSKTVESDLRKYLSLTQQTLIKSYWFYPGSNFVKNVSSSGISKEQSCYLNNLKNFNFNFLMVGTIEPRKGHKTVLEIFSHLWKSYNDKISLTFIGKEGWMVDDLTKSIKTSDAFNKNLFWFNDASDSFLDQCYKQTDAVIIASINEGFGLPILEAAQRKCRVIANDIPIFREVAPKECFFLELTNPLIAIGQLKDWFENPSEPCTNAQVQTWKEATLQILKKTSLI